MRVTLLVLLALGLMACKSRGSDSQVLQQNGYNPYPGPGNPYPGPGNPGGNQPVGGENPVDTHRIDRTFGHGESFNVSVDANREIKQITVRFAGRYTMPTGELNDEGDPYFKDGMYCNGYIEDQYGRRRAVSRRKFVENRPNGGHEVDNWYDLSVQGSRLTLEFEHDARYLSEVRHLNRRIHVADIRITYADDPNAQFVEFMYNNNPDDYDIENRYARGVRSGGMHRVTVDRNLWITRVDVRWGDAKPRDANGVYQAGVASGALFINRRMQGRPRNVAAMETQIWTDFDVPAYNGDTEIAVSIRNDDARIHWIRVYHR